MGMKNHDLVPVQLIANIAKLRHGGTHKILSTLLTFKLIAHDRSVYDGKFKIVTFKGKNQHNCCITGGLLVERSSHRVVK